jgi:hypothetical protein
LDHGAWTTEVAAATRLTTLGAKGKSDVVAFCREI